MSRRSEKKAARAAATEPYRKLSPWRVMLGILILAGLSAGAVYGFHDWQATRVVTSHKPWFASYVDVTATPTFAFEQMGTTSHKDAVLSFIVSLQGGDGCTPSWGSAYTLDKAGANLDLDRRIARLQQQGGSVAVSFGGLDNTELAVSCTDPVKLYNAYKSVVDRYDVSTIDLDLENKGLKDTAAAARRADAIAKLQTERRKAHKSLAVWVTLPVIPQGLAEDGTNAVSQLLSHHVDLAGVNVMTMDYGNSISDGDSMAKASESALTQTARQLSILYQRAGIHLNDTTVWTKLGATPMIGQNDDEDQVFGVSDAKEFNSFALSHHVSRMSMWSANRDIPCGGNYVSLKVVSTSCSGVSQNKLQFADLLSHGYTGSMDQSAGLVTTSDPVSKASQAKDDPAKSPYPIWTATSAYLEGTKVVWHHSVYQAKWWTQGDVPDNPVLQTWQTPWELIGPVLPNETPVPQQTLPAGTYPTWDGNGKYDTGQRVLFNGIPYQAKWWNEGESPAAAASNPDTSPWTPLTQSQVNDILSQLNSAKK
jgi:chitinase